MGVGVINQNISALNSLRNLQATDRSMNRSLERLSSGLRINRAADDAAGLAVSEKMRGQISGLRQAKRNAQDGISMIQTAEAVMTSVHNILQRLRVLAVQAANDSYSTLDRQQLQKECTQLIDEVDRIAQYTEFNTKKIINGNTLGHANTADSKTLTAEVYGKVINADYSITVLDAGSACNIHGNANIEDADDTDSVVNLRDVGVHGTEEMHICVDGQTRVLYVSEDDTLQDIVYKINDAKIGIKAGLDQEGNDLTLTSVHSGSRFNISFGDDPDGVALKLGLQGGGKGSLTSSNYAIDSSGNALNHSQFSSGTDTIISITNITAQSQFKTNPGAASEAGGYGRSLGIFTSDSKIFTEKELSRPINLLAATLTRPAWDDIAGNGVDNSDIVDLTSSDLLKGLTIYIDEDLDNGTLQQSTDDEAETDFTGYWPDSYNTPPGDPVASGQTDHQAAVPNAVNGLGTASSNTISLTSTRLSVRDTRQIFHTGPNQGHTLTVDFGNLSASSLDLIVPLKSGGNINDGRSEKRDGSTSQNYKLYLSIETQDSAEGAITIIDNALNRVSELRSSLGAYQNSMEKTIEYLEIADENLSSSESRIRDVDMAEEMSDFTRSQILMQSGTAMLAQANAKPQGILQLLR